MCIMAAEKAQSSQCFVASIFAIDNIIAFCE